MDNLDCPVIVVFLTHQTRNFIPALTETKVTEHAFPKSCHPAHDRGLRLPFPIWGLFVPGAPRFLEPIRSLCLELSRVKPAQVTPVLFPLAAELSVLLGRREPAGSGWLLDRCWSEGLGSRTGPAAPADHLPQGLRASVLALLSLSFPV